MANFDCIPGQSGDRRGFLSQLGHDTAGNTLALATAGIMALMGMVGGAVDISRSYMVQSRLQQACDAGALAARKAMSGETLTQANKNVGYRYFDFNFPPGTLGASLTSRTYTQPTSSLGTPQAVVNGTVIATVPTTIMRAFGNESVDLKVTCSSKMEIQSADVAMVLDVTGSMATNMKISSSGWASEPRINALHKAVRAFYDALGPGRAGGDLSKGRIRYAFVPYGVVVNVGHLLTHDQMVNQWTYQSREVKDVWTWNYANYSSETSANYSAWSPTSAPGSFDTEAKKLSNYASFGTSTVGTGNGNYTYTKLDGTSGSLARTPSANSSTACSNLNNLLVGGVSTGLKDVGKTTTEDESSSEVAPNYPDTKRDSNWTKTRTTRAIGFRYRWFNTSWYGGSNACHLESAVGNDLATWTQTQTKTTSRNITWTKYTNGLVYEPRSIDVSGLKAWNGGWNDQITIPNFNIGGYSTQRSVKLSGSTVQQTIRTYSGSATGQNVIWRGCVEERKMVNTITSSTPLNAIPAGAYDLDNTLLAVSGNDDTRWRPWLYGAVYDPDSESLVSGEECPAPALRLQEIADYEQSILASSYPNLFEANSSDPDSFYYPYTSSLWSGSGSNAQRSKNTFTLRNYIQRIDTSRGLTDGTLHDAGFMWGIHLVSGVGMFASDNPDRWNGQVVNRNIVFMTDGEMNPGEERYVFSGYNRRDGRLAPTSTTDSQMKVIENRRLRIQCEAAKREGITVWVVVITSSDTDSTAYDELKACASASGNFKAAATTEELVQSFTNIANSIGGLRISQ